MDYLDDDRIDSDVDDRGLLEVLVGLDDGLIHDDDVTIVIYWGLW